MLAVCVCFGHCYVVCVHEKENPLDSSSSSQVSLVPFRSQTVSTPQNSHLSRAHEHPFHPVLFFSRLALYFTRIYIVITT
jgi:hypothetical protein